MTKSQTGTPIAATVPDDDLKLLLLIRHMEYALLDLFAEGAVGGTVHTCLGQEYVPVALRPFLSDAFVLSNHRGHGHYLAHYEDPIGLLAEILGRRGAVCGGRGGSQHIYRDRFLSTGVQGESVPVGCGIALGAKRRGSPRLVVIYIGDGTWGEGSVYEALNMAALWGLPVVLVVENNGIAQSTRTSTQMAGTVRGRAAGFGIEHVMVDDVDVLRIRTRLEDPFRDVVNRQRPLVVEFATRRLGPHSKGDDGRSEGELEALRAADWAPYYRLAQPEWFDHWDAEQKRKVAGIVEDVRARPRVSGEVSRV